MATLTCTIDATSRSPLQAGTTISLGLPRSTASLILYDSAGTLSIAMGDEVLVADSGTNIFRGTVSERSYSRDSAGLGGNQRLIHLRCKDLVDRFDRPPALISKAYSVDSDQNIFIDLVAEASLDGVITANASNIKQLDASITIEVGPYATLTSALNAVAKHTGGHWWLTADKVLHYDSAANATASAWNVSGTPDDSTTFAVDSLSYTVSLERLANSVFVFGGIGPDGVSVNANATDSTSISAHGTYVVAIDTQDVVTQASAAELAEIAKDELSDEAEQAAFGLSDSAGADLLIAGETITITDAGFGLSAKKMTINSVGLRQVTDSETYMVVDCGEQVPSYQRYLDRLSALNRSVSSQSTTHPLGLSFDDSTAQFNAGSTPNIDSGWWSVSFWLYPDTKPDGSAAELAVVGDGTGSGWQLIWSTDDKLEFRHSRAVTDTVLISAADPLTLGRWNHVLLLIVPGSGNASIYVDNVELSYTTETQGANVWALNTEDFVFGANLDGVMRAFVMRLDDWSADERAQLSESPAPRPSTDINFFTPLDHEWMMDDFGDGATASGSGTIKDSVGSADADPENSPVGRGVPFIPST